MLCCAVESLSFHYNSTAETGTNEVSEGNAKSTYVGLKRITSTNYGIAYKPRGSWQRSRNSSPRTGISNRLHGEVRQVI